MIRKSLRGQLTRAAMVTTLLAMLLSAGALLAYELLTYRNVWSSDLRTQADLIAQSTAAAVVFDDPKAAHENLALLKTRPAIQAAAIYGKGGARLATYTAAGSEPPDDEATAVAEPEVSFNGSTIEVSYPVVQGSEPVGTLYVRAKHNIAARLVSYAVILGLVTAGGLAMAFYVFGRLQDRVTVPLAEMTDVAQRVISSKDWSLRAPDTEYEDIRILVDAFNEMLRQCEERTTELEREIGIRERAEQDLRMADKRKDQFLATLAHELRNPLAPMSNALALVKRPEIPAAARGRAIEILGRQLRHMVRFIDDLLDASRIATGKLSLDREPVDLVQVVRSAVELAEPVAANKGVRLSLSTSSEKLPVSGDAVRLSQVFSNILSNACKYTPAGGAIDVAYAGEGGKAVITVRDTGIGVAPEMQERIFDMFEQADKSIGRGEAGLGVGLTLARRLVELHGGSLSMRSEGLGHGSCFSVAIPLLEQTDVPEPVSEAAATNTPKMRILIADDNVDLTESLAQLLRLSGHHVQVARDGDAAIQAIDADLPDLAILDIGMPGRNGYEVARHLREDPRTRSIHLIAVTGWGQASDKAEATRAGFDRHLVKPVDPVELLRVCEDLMGMH